MPKKLLSPHISFHTRDNFRFERFARSMCMVQIVKLLLIIKWFRKNILTTAAGIQFESRSIHVCIVY